MKETIQRLGGKLSAMVIPNIGAFIAWGLITAIFIPTGWLAKLNVDWVHSGIDREYGADISSLSVKRKIEQLIEDENPRKPVSDSALAAALKREGINIARRTVAKYRDELGVPSSTHRKKIF